MEEVSVLMNGGKRKKNKKKEKKNPVSHLFRLLLQAVVRWTREVEVTLKHTKMLINLSKEKLIRKRT